MADTNGAPDNEEMYDHWNTIKTDAATRMDATHALQNQNHPLL